MKAFVCWFCMAMLVQSVLAAEPEPDLVIAEAGQTEAVVVVSPEAQGQERRAADDLVHYIELMSGAKLPVVDTEEAIPVAMSAKTPLVIVGEEALKADRSLRARLSKVAKPDPVWCADAIVLRRDGNRVYLAGTNDASHYFAVAELLRQWGCRWYMPTEFGECIPAHDRLEIGALDIAYAPPFEWRGGGGVPGTATLRAPKNSRLGT